MWQEVAKTAAARPIGACLVVVLAASGAWAQGTLSTVRDDVRDGSSGSVFGSIHDDHCDDDHDGSLFGSIVGGFLGAVLSDSSDDHCDDCEARSYAYQNSAAAYQEGPPPATSNMMSAEWSAAASLPLPPDYQRSSPIEWAPPTHFPRYPYQRINGYMMSDSWPATIGDSMGNPAGPDPLNYNLWPTKPRRWSARVRADYGDSFDDDITRIGGHLLVSTSSRWGLDTEMSYLQESLPAGGEDHLWMGDCNIVYRFCQSERRQWRAGVGFNWLDDRFDSDCGFNFTLGADFYPKRPWIVSGTIDWGTLGHAEFFKFRSTAGVILYGMETYGGVEYYDIGTSQISSLIAGVRVWF